MAIHEVYYYHNAGVRHVFAVSARRSRKDPPARGKVEGCSLKSMRRLRSALMLYTCPGVPSYAVTLTIRDCASPSVWRKRCHAYWAALGRDNSFSACIWRVELQRRGVPHLHCVMWCADEFLPRLRDIWLNVWGCHDEASYFNAVDVRPIDESWLGYISLHHSKKSDQSAGWEGRQWGIVGRAALARRCFDRFELTDLEHSYFVRLYGRVLRGIGRRVGLPPVGSFDHIGGDYYGVSECIRRSRRWAARVCPF